MLDAGRYGESGRISEGLDMTANEEAAEERRCIMEVENVPPEIISAVIAEYYDIEI